MPETQSTSKSPSQISNSPSLPPSTPPTAGIELSAAKNSPNIKSEPPTYPPSFNSSDCCDNTRESNIENGENKCKEKNEVFFDKNAKKFSNDENEKLNARHVSEGSDDDEVKKTQYTPKNNDDKNDAYFDANFATNAKQQKHKRNQHSNSLPQTPVYHQGPRPITPLPPPPQISAADLTLLTEISANQNGTFQCTLCHKQFGYKNGLIRHVRLTHVGEKPYQCNICNRRFGYKHILLEHQNLHFGNRPYACSQCDKRFAARSNLIQHRTVHKRPYHCHLCNKRFDREDQLKKHLFAHPQSLMTCQYCDFSTSISSEFSHHLEKNHENFKNRNGVYEGKARSKRNSFVGGEDNVGKDRNDENNFKSLENFEKKCANKRSFEKSFGEKAHESVNESKSMKVDNNEKESYNFDDVDVKKEVVDNVENFPSNEVKHNKTFAFDENKMQSFCRNQTHSSQVDENYKLKNLRPSDLDPNLLSFRPVEDKANLAQSMNHDFDFKFQKSVNTTNTWNNSEPLQQHNMQQFNNRFILTDDKSKTLPGIHEVFWNSKSNSLPSFSNFIPSSSVHLKKQQQLKQNHVKQQMKLQQQNFIPSDLEIGFSQQQQQQQLHKRDHQNNTPHNNHNSNQDEKFPNNVPNNFSTLTSSINSTTHRPTAQLPPITNKQTKDQAIQHACSLVEFPSLEDVMSYYVGQGQLFKCHHCNILFFERGMFFLHSSLHSFSNPWQCSICHKICSDKNEFTLHFVNQQHNS